MADGPPIRLRHEQLQFHCCANREPFSSPKTNNKTWPKRKKKEEPTGRVAAETYGVINVIEEATARKNGPNSSSVDKVRGLWT